MNVLSERGPLDLPDLLAATSVGLGQLLHALKDVRDFRLVELVGDDTIVQLTSAGRRTLTSLLCQDSESEPALLEQK